MEQPLLFAIVDPDPATVTVYSRTAGGHIDHTGENVPVPLLETSAGVAALFAGL